MIKKLRQWQSECADKALSDFSSGKNHFFCLAATATGKTVMASEVAKRLLASNAVDIVLCFCPSTEIQKGIQRTFGIHLNRLVDGSIQSVGSVHTYQGMLAQPEKFWQLFNTLRVFTVFDEIHHCAGTAFSKNNAWGAEILNIIAHKSRYVLCSSGTPWRSDRLPITTALYDVTNKLQCDFTYGLADAVRDNVCRKPSIVLVDNSKVCVDIPSLGKQYFESISQALRETPLSYLRIIRDLTAQRCILQKAVRKLSCIRDQNPNAGGLVVCSSIEHAEQVAQILRCEFHQQTVAVSYLHPNASAVIDTFRRGSGS